MDQISTWRKVNGFAYEWGSSDFSSRAKVIGRSNSLVHTGALRKSYFQS